MPNDTNNINALVLAGGINRIVLYDGYIPGYKGLLPVGGKPLIRYTLEALRGTPEVKRICIVGPIDQIRISITDSGGYEFLDGSETLIQNIQKGLHHFSVSTPVLIIPSDLPLATPQAIRDFLAKCGIIETEYRSNILWSMVPEKDFTGQYAMVKKGFNRFRDISVCHGNLLLATPSLIENRNFISRMENIYNARKSSIRAALAVGPFVGLSYLIGVHLLKLMTISRFAKIASAGFGIGLVPVITDYPDIAVDIDEARDYQFIIEELERRGKIFLKTIP